MYEGDEARPAYEGEARDRRPGQVARALDELDEALHMLSSIAEEAHAKLGPALRPEEPRPVNPDARGALSEVRRTSELAERILGARSRTRALVGSLGELLERVDL